MNIVHHSASSEHAHRRLKLDHSRRRPDTIPHRFLRTALARSSLPAVVDPDGSVTTYGALAQRSQAIAAGLRRRGVSRNIAVLVSMCRSADRIATQLAILMAGGCYVHVDPQWPPNRLAHLSELVRSRLMILDGPETGDGVPDVETVTVSDILRRSNQASIEISAVPEDLAYISFTSGSTGAPKAVPTTHSAVINLVHSPTYVTISESSKILHMAPATFDAATYEVWAPLLNRGTCVLLREGLFRCGDFERSVQRFGVSHVFVTTALFNTVVDEVPSALHNLESILTGGEAHDVDHMRRALKLARHGVTNVYGPTEATTFATHHPVVGLPDEAIDVPIGTPIQGTGALVVEAGAPVGTDGVGELWLYGEGLSPGYLGLDDDTNFARVTVDDRAYRVYRTGDIARIDSQGLLRFVGRIDDQVKRRGHRIEPGEILAQLSAHQEVVQSAVVATTGPLNQTVLTAFVVPASSRLNVPELIAHLRGKVPEYLLPDDIELIESMPLNRNGKIDHDALRQRAAKL